MQLDINEIMKILPHRYPFLMVDRITEVEQGQRCVGIKNVTINEPFFPGHFPVLVRKTDQAFWPVLSQ